MRKYKSGALKYKRNILLSWPILTFIASFFLILSFPMPGISYFAWFALFPYFLVILKEKLKRVIFSTLILNFTFNFFYLIWLKEYKQPLTLPLSLIAELIYLMPQAVLSWFVIKLVPKHFKVFSIASIWVFFDYLKTVGFLAFPWGIIGYTQYANSLLIQNAELFGVWGINFLLIFFNASVAMLIYIFISNPEHRFNFIHFQWINLYFSLFLIIVSMIFGLFIFKRGIYTGNRSIRLSLIQANFNPWSPQLSKNLKKEFKLTGESLKYNPDMIVWSESSVPFPFDFYLKKRNRYALKIDSFIKNVNREFVFGSLSFEGLYKNGNFSGTFYNVAYYYKPNASYSSYRKIHLVPFGEWFPYKKLFPFVVKILKRARAGDFKPGTEFKVFNGKNLRFNVLICFEDVFGNLARQFVKKGSEMMINITNDAWSGSRMAELQHFSISIFRTVENRVPLIRVSNGGVTAYVDSYGRVIKKLPLFESKYLICDVKYSNIKNRKLTFYTRYGDFLPYILIILMISIVLTNSIRKLLT